VFSFFSSSLFFALVGPPVSTPLAKYIETTIFFADLKGFTKWCANRQPVEVFTLLETLYGEFDKVAQRRRVYKVETVGTDLYIIVSFTSS